MMVASNNGLMWGGDSSPDRMGFSAARNKVAQAMLEGGKDLADGIIWVDSDIRMPPKTFLSLLASARQFNASFVTGVYHQRGGLHRPVFYEWDERAKTFRSAMDYPPNVFAPTGGCGFGIVWTGLDVIEKIADHPDFDDRTGWFPDRRDAGGFGEDLSFCHLAIKAGVQLYVNTEVQVGHLGDPEVITKEHYVKALSELSLFDKSEPKKEEREKWGR